MMKKTMHRGISLYPGLGRSREENLARLEQAAALGFTDLFLSFHIPETDEGAFAEQVNELLERAAALGLRTVGDLVPGKAVPVSLTCLRLDDGYTPEAMAALQARYPGKILVLNASALTENQLQAMEKAGVALFRVEALHNFYPHPHTGLSEAYFQKQNGLLHRYGVKVGAFVPSRKGCRGPLYEGLPTMEKDRHRAVRLAARHALLLGADAVYMGDDGPSEDELRQLAAMDPDVVKLDLVTEQKTELHDILQTHIYETRPDEAEDVIRTTNSRALWKNIPIPDCLIETSDVRCQTSGTCGSILSPTSNVLTPDNKFCHLSSVISSQNRPADHSLLPPGTLTLDSDAYGRYKGELEITLTELPYDERTIILGRIPEEELFLLEYLRGGRKFRICVD